MALCCKREKVSLQKHVPVRGWMEHRAGQMGQERKQRGRKEGQKDGQEGRRKERRKGGKERAGKKAKKKNSHSHLCSTS